MGDQAWKGLAALAGSWIGGGANFVAIGESAGASANTMSMMVIVDIAVAELWMVALLIFAGREKQMDEKIGADRSAIDDVREKIERLLPQVRGVPFVMLSALYEDGLSRLLDEVFAVYERWNRRVGTSDLNQWLDEMTSLHPPPAVRGRRIRLRYITQAKSRPPTFVVFSSRADQLPQSYTRYLINGLRDTFDLPGVPLRVVTRKPKNPYAGKSRS